MTATVLLSPLLAGGTMTVHDFKVKTIDRTVVAHLESGVEPTSAELKKAVEAVPPKQKA